MATTTPQASVAFRHVSNTLVAVLCLGGAVNFLTDYEWMPFRCIDLYSWAPASKVYRPHWHAPLFFLPSEFSVTDGMDFNDLPGLPVYDKTNPGDTMYLDMMNVNYPSRSLEARLRTKILESRKYTPKNATGIELHLVNVYVAVEPSRIPISWYQFFFDSTAPRVSIRCHSSFRSMQKQLKGVTGGIPYKGRGFSTSVLYWVLMFVPVAMLAVDTRLPGTDTSARRALFTSFPRLLVHLKFWLWDNAVLVYMVGQAKSLDAWGLAAWSNRTLFSMTIASALATGWLRGRSLRGHAVVAAVWTFNLQYKCLALAAVSFAIRDYETNKNVMFPSMYAALFAQSLAVCILADLLVRFRLPCKRSESALISRDEIESGLIKFVCATFFYSAGATKLGSCGLHWIDDRYIVQLALRGRLSRDSPFPFESLILDAPPLIRAVGMATVLLMELSSLYAWYSFGSYVLVWFIFLVGSTLTIGVPLHPAAFGTLQPLADWTIGPLLQSNFGPVVMVGLMATLLWVTICTKPKKGGAARKSN